MPQIGIQSEWIPLTPFSGGVNIAVDPTLIQANQVRDAFNVSFEYGTVKIRNGFHLRWFEATNSAGSSRSEGAFPIFDGIWVTSSDTGSNTTAGSVSGAIADKIQNICYFWNKSASWSEVYLSDTFAYYYSYTSGVVTDIFCSNEKRLCFTSGDMAFHSWTIAPKTSGAYPTLVFTNGLSFSAAYSTANHSIYWFEGSAHANLDDGQVNMAGITGFDYAKQIIWYANHFLIGYYKDGSNVYPNGVACGLNGEIGITGTTGDQREFLLDSEGYIQRFIRLGNHLVIYLNKSIVVCDPVPTDEIYNFDPRVQGTGLLGPGLVVDIGGIHIFIGQDNIYMYDGGLRPYEIGTVVWDHLKRMINLTNVNKYSAHHIAHKDIARFNLEGGQYAEFNYRDRTWSFGQYGIAPRCMGYGYQSGCYKTNFYGSDSSCSMCWTSWSKESSDADYNDGEGIESPYTNSLANSFEMDADYEVTTFGDENGNVWELTDAAPEDNDEPIHGHLVTRSVAIGSPRNSIGQVIKVRIESFGGDKFTAAYSVDSGTTYETLRAVDGSPKQFGGHSKWTTDEVPVDGPEGFGVIGEFFQLMLLFSGGSPEIRICSVMAKPYAPRML